MSFWTETTPIVDLECWQDVESCVRQFPAGVSVVLEGGGPFVQLDVYGYRGSHLLVADDSGSLHAQDRRRLHRLGLRLTPGSGTQCWTWAAPPAVVPPPTADHRDVMLARMRGWSTVEDDSRNQLVAVLRDGLRLRPAQLQITSLADDDPEAQFMDEYLGIDDEDDDWLCGGHG